MVEVVALRQGALEDGSDGLLHVGRGHAAVAGEDDDDGHLERGEDVRGRAEVAEAAEDARQEDAHIDEVRLA